MKKAIFITLLLISRLTGLDFCVHSALALPESGLLIPLQTDYPDTLASGTIQQLGFFPELPDLTKVWFENAPWGGVIAHLELKSSPAEPVILRERSLSGSRWQKMQRRAAQLSSGVPLTSDSDAFSSPVAAADTTFNRVRTWPEVPPRNRHLPAGLDEYSAPRYPDVAGKWLLSGGVGYQHNISSYSDYFTPMAHFQMQFARGFNSKVIAYSGFSVGLGALPSDLEGLVGEGHSSNYSAMLGLLLRLPVKDRTSVYAGAQSGYFRRSLQWGGIYTDPETGEGYDGYARENGGLGFLVEVGLWLQKSHSRKSRFLDFSLGLKWGPADSWEDTGQDVHFSAEGNDTWLMLTFRFWDQI
ncbi:MAG: hypothetical protein GY780_13055 [bacterium]|nr:hypothetical protein [bacterium]